MRTSRLEAFCDGVFAIAATLLVLELKVPQGQGDLMRALIDQWPTYAAYVVSFATIGIIWVNHHTLLEHVRRVDRTFLYLNLNLLIWVAIVPFPTSVVDAYLQDERQAPAALLLYGVAFLIAVAFASLFFYATREGGLVGDAAQARRIREEGRLFPIGLLTYAAGMALAFVSPTASLAAYALTAAFYALPRLPLAPPR